MLTTIISSIMPSQKISVYTASNSNLIYEGRNDQFRTSTNCAFTDYTVESMHTLPSEDTIYIYITEKEV